MQFWGIQSGLFSYFHHLNQQVPRFSLSGFFIEGWKADKITRVIFIKCWVNSVLVQKKWILRPVLATQDRVKDKTIKSVLDFMNFGEEMSFLLFSFYMYMLHFHRLERSLIALVRVGWVQDPCSFKNDLVNLSLIPLLDS